ncbi:hypothetical protein F5B20DRAFT_566837 [Whalleya microplaca]|nr:hypothetical protein F5B20DRAFT_566837 [Whalleya microplaca]
MSFSVHQASVIALRKNFSRSRAAKTWRTVWMTALFVMVLFAQVLIYNDNFLKSPGGPAQCVWNGMIGTYNDNIAKFSINIIRLVWGYLATLAILWPSIFANLPNMLLVLVPLAQFHFWVMGCVTQSYQMLAKATEHWRESPLSVMRAALVLRAAMFQLFWTFVKPWVWTLSLIAFTAAELFRSLIVDLWRLFGSLLWCTASIFKLRSAAASHDLIDGNETEWGFGQILPLLLLALPLMSIVEYYQDSLAEGSSALNRNQESGGETESTAAITSDTATLREEPSVISPGSPATCRYSGRKTEDILNRPERQDTEQRIGLPDDLTKRDTKTIDGIELIHNLLEKIYQYKLVQVSGVFMIWVIFGFITWTSLKRYPFPII